MCLFVQAPVLKSCKLIIIVYACGQLWIWCFYYVLFASAVIGFSTNRYLFNFDVLDVMHVCTQGP